MDTYVNDGYKILHKCKNNHTWLARPNHILRGIYCPECAAIFRGLKRRKNKETYEKEIKKIHSGRISVLGEYQGAFIKLKHKCNVCNFNWVATPDNLINSTKSGCPRCAKGKAHSNKAIRWLKEESKKRGIRIRHAENWGEFIIPNTRLKVDGYHRPTNTIFEFYGNVFHGNLEIYKPRQKPHPYLNKTAKQLWKETHDRENYLRNLGYNLVTIWEKDYDDYCKSKKR